MQFPAFLKTGKLQYRVDLVKAYLAALKDGPMTISIAPKKKIASDPLRNYYYGVVLKTFMDHIGYEPQDAEQFHTNLKAMFFQIQPDELGVYRGIPKVFTKSRDSVEIEKAQLFVEWVKRFAAEKGVYVPDPNE